MASGNANSYSLHHIKNFIFMLFKYVTRASRMVHNLCNPDWDVGSTQRGSSPHGIGRGLTLDARGEDQGLLDRMTRFAGRPPWGTTRRVSVHE